MEGDSNEVSQEIVEEAVTKETSEVLLETDDAPAETINTEAEESKKEVENADEEMPLDEEEQEDDEANSQKSADEVIQTAIGGPIKNADDGDNNDESDGEGEFHLSKEENDLLSEERLDRESPEMWPKEKTSEAPAWAKGLTQDDIDQIFELGSLSKPEVIAEVKKLYDLSYKLGVQEAKEMTRGRYLNIFSSLKKK